METNLERHVEIVLSKRLVNKKTKKKKRIPVIVANLQESVNIFLIKL